MAIETVRKIKVVDSNNKLKGEFTLKFDIFDEIIFSGFKPENNLNWELENQLHWFSLHFIMLTQSSDTLEDVVKKMNDEQMKDLDNDLKLVIK